MMNPILLSRATVLCVGLSFCACDPSEVRDAGSDATVPEDAPMVLCAADRECGDQRLFCSRRRCTPSAAGADAMGCVEMGSPCPTGVPCDEERDACGAPGWCTDGRDGCTAPGDCDGDGSDAMECGGNDCDDMDPGRYPANPEVCDDDNVDEDCDTTTFGMRDRDTDGFLDATCCNVRDDGSFACGSDCDDELREVRPDAIETCNARDDNCDGIVDESGATPICPGGICAGGVCDLMGWDHTIGGPNADQVLAVHVDVLGNVVIGGQFQSTVAFPDVSRMAVGGFDAFIMSYGADGSFQWGTAFGGTGIDRVLGISSDAMGRVYAVGQISGRVDLGGGFEDEGPEGAFILALDRDSTFRWNVTWPGTARGVDVAGSVTAVGIYTAEHDFGGGPQPHAGQGDAIVINLAYDGSYNWDYSRGTSREDRASSVSFGAAGIVVGGRTRAELNLGGDAFGVAPRWSGFVVELTFAGAYAWDHSFTMAATGDRLSVGGVAAGPMGVYVVGSITGSADLGDGVRTSSRLGSAFILGLTTAGAYAWDRTLGRAGATMSWAIGTGVAIEGGGDIGVVGSFGGRVEFGGGTRTAGASFSDVYLAEYSAGGSPRRSRAWGTAGSNSANAFSVGAGNSRALGGGFNGDVDFGSGERSAAGDLDGFVIRLAN